mmetsp:Transcript_7886/g.20365  ORF Transcript_7886/g.20365 Transcript_7886/m.20365 type:complete len:219 (+) Transcript_7886:203-859(+)
MGYEAVAPPSQRRGIERPVTFVRRERFEVVAVDHRSRASLLMLRWRGDDEARAQPPVFVANVHLQGDPLAVETRRSQLASVRKRLALLRELHDVDVHSSRAVLCGDFNEPAVTALHGELTQEGGDWGPPDAWPLHDVYAELRECPPPATFRGYGRSARIDFLYRSCGLRTRSVRWPLPAEEEHRLEWSWHRWPPWPELVPCSWYASDHLPLAALFRVV